MSTPVRAAEGPTAPSTSEAESAPAESPAESDGESETPADVPTEREEALDALEQVEEFAEPVSRTVARERIQTAAGRNVTMDLRDLSLRMDALPASSQRVALSNFSRPWGEGEYATLCDAVPDVDICVHYVPNGTTGADATHAVNPATWPQTVLATLVDIARTYRAAGYRLPKADGTYGGSGATDVYLADVASRGQYGYCTADFYASGHPVFDPGPGRSDLPAFCVLDNDYAASQFGTDPLRTLQVTAAHEYSHAVQFAYDYGEDRWFMEAAATWAEEQIYDEINDNRQYLRFSQLRFPGVSLDRNLGSGDFLKYGDWIFFQYLTERIPTLTGPMPNLMLSIWQYADSVTGPDYYSTRAIEAALARRGARFPRLFAQYALANRHPSRTYAEGSAFPVGRPTRTRVLRPTKRSNAGGVRVDHLASKTVRFVPRRLPAKRNRLRITVDMADRASGSVAMATVYSKAGGIRTRFVRLNKRGNGSVRVDFNSRRVAHVELVLVNANRRYKQCWTARTGYSCRGIPVRDGVLEKYSVRVVR